MPDHTLGQVGKSFGVTRERIRQIEAKALQKLSRPTMARKLLTSQNADPECGQVNTASDVPFELRAIRFALPRGLGGLRRRRRPSGNASAGFTVDDVGALAEFLKHCAGYARDVRTALIQSSWPEHQIDR